MCQSINFQFNIILVMLYVVSIFMTKKFVYIGENKILDQV